MMHFIIKVKPIITIDMVHVHETGKYIILCTYVIHLEFVLSVTQGPLT